MPNHREMAEEIFRAGVAAVQPDQLIRRQLSVRDGILRIAGAELDLGAINKIYVIGAGKAIAFMARELESLLGNRLTEGQIIVKHGHGCPLQRIRISEAAHPTPDANGVHAAADILDLVKRATADDLVLCLFSGGASALLADCVHGAQLADLIKLNQLLVRSGAEIGEINTVRKHLSKIKGGQLARACRARMMTLVLSDVIGDPLDVIASGPSVPDLSTFADALAVVKTHDLEPKLPPVLLKYLQDGVLARNEETPKPGDSCFEKTWNIIIGNNRMALEGARKKAIELGFDTRLADLALSENAAGMARKTINYAMMHPRNSETGKDICVLFGGETTLKVEGDGLGGRNQHLALAAAIELAGHPGITVLAAGTDGTDGPTDAAGAVVDSRTVAEAAAKGLDPDGFLKRFDSYHFFKTAGGHVVTGPTMTNVMDIAVVLVRLDSMN